MITVIVDGIAYGLLLFVLSVGLSITLGLMNFVNLAHGAFAMAGGYVTVILVNQAGVPFLPSLGAAFVVAALIGVALERTLYVHLYRRSPLDQVLFSIGLVLMAMSAIDYLMGAQQQLIRLPDWLRGQVSLLGVSIGAYRLFIIAICGALTLVLQLILARTRFGSRLRASVDDPSVARGLGIDVDRIFTLTFATGSGLAGLGGALGIEVLGLDPTFPVKFMIYFLIVVVVGGTTSITGPFFTSIVLGIGDIAGKYYVPELGAFVIYAMMIVILILRPQGLFTRPAR
jgi:branched-chain amino acid transport system permease protein